MTIRASEPITPFWYTPKNEEGKENPTQFHLKPLTGVEMFEAEMHVEDGDLKATAKGARAALRLGLLDWKNFSDSSGPVLFDKNDKDANLSRLPYGLAADLFRAIFEHSILTEAARKN